MESIMVREIMRKTDVALSPTVSLDAVSDHLSKHHLAGAPVIDEQGMLIGYVSEYDCLQQLMQSTYYCDTTALAEDVMSTKLISSSADISILDMASKMNSSKVNVMPLVDESGKLVGAVSRGDIMRALVKELESCNIPS